MTSNNVIPFPSTRYAGANITGPTPSGNNNPNSLEWLREQVWTIKHHGKLNEDQRRRALFNFITTQESHKTSRGAFLKTRDHRTYLFDGRGCRLYKIDEADPEYRGYMFDLYGINSADSMFKHITASLQNSTIANGRMRDVRRFSYWDRDEECLYISRFDGTCYRIDGDEILIRPNGYGSAVFLDDDGGSNCDTSTKTGPEVGNHHELFKRLIDDLQYVPSTVGGMSPDIQKTCLGIWIFATAFPDLMPTKPVLLVEGSHGSGKTLFLQRIAMVLHGKYTPLTIPKKEDPDFGIKILRSPLPIIDDVNGTVEWFQDTLCTYATGGKWTRRKLFSDDSEVVIQPQSFMAITTNAPGTFRQGQVADRCLIIRLERRADKAGFVAADELFDSIRYWRAELQGEWLYWLNEIVRELRKPQVTIPSKYRMADFARLAHLIGRVLNQPAGPPGDWSPAAVDEMLACMQAERDALMVDEGDTLVDLLDKWLDSASNQGREIKISDLHRELVAIAKALGHTSFFKSARSLGNRIREASGALARHFQIDSHSVSGGSTVFTFRRN